MRLKIAALSCLILGLTACSDGRITSRVPIIVRTDPNLPRPVSTESWVAVPNVVGTSMEKAVATIAQKGLRAVAHGRGRVEKQQPPAGTRVPAGKRIRLKGSSG